MKFRSFGPLTRTNGVRGLTVHRLELRAVDRHARRRQQAELPTQRHELRADLADRWASVSSEVGDGLVIRRQTARQPHHFDIAASLALKPPARLHPVEIAINVELQQHRRMIARPPRRLRHSATEPETAQIELIDENIDHPNRIVFVDPVLQALREQRALSPIHTLDKPLH